MQDFQLNCEAWVGLCLQFYTPMTSESVAGQEMDWDAREEWEKDGNLESMQKPALNGANDFFQGSDSKTRKEGRILYW